MGTGKTGRYLNTKGSARRVSDFAAVHSNEGTFVKPHQDRPGKDKKKICRLRLASDGHGQKGMDLLDKYNINYTVVKTYPNGVRIGYVQDHYQKSKRKGINQAWFPKEWTEKDIVHAGEHVAGLKGNRHAKDGVTVFGVYKGVRVGIKKTNGKIATVFPDSNQKQQGHRRKK